MSTDWAVGDPVMLGFALFFTCSAWGTFALLIGVVFFAPVGALLRMVFAPFIIALVVFCATMAFDVWTKYLGTF